MAKDQLLYGIHPLSEALESGTPIEKVLIQRGLHRSTAQELLNKLRQAGVPFQFVPREKLDRVTRKNHQGVVAYIAPVPFHDLEWLVPQLFEQGEVPLLLALDRISDVRNFGAICRSAECAGVHAIIIPEKGSAQIGEDAIKTSAGALLRIPVCRVRNLRDAVHFLSLSGIAATACHEKGAQAYWEADFSAPTVLIMGSEDEGIHSQVLSAAQASVSIPMAGQTASLNVSVAAALVIYEAVRQRRLSQ